MTDMVHGNSKFYITKLIPFSKLTFYFFLIKGNAEVKVNVNLANKYKVKAKNFIIPILYFSVFFPWLLAWCNTSTIDFSASVSFFFKDFFNASKEQVTIIGI